MTITPADALDIQIAKGPPSAEGFAKLIAGLPGAYYAGLDEAYKRRNQDAFVNGLPQVIGPDGQPTGQIDTTAAYNTIARLGGVDKALPVIQSMNQQAADANIASIQTGGGGNSAYFPNALGSTVSGAPPPTAPTSLPRTPSDGTGQSITGIVTSSGFTGPAADNLARALSGKYGVDQTQQLSPELSATIQQYAAQVAGARQPAQQPQQPPQPQPGFQPQAPAAAAAPTTDPTAGGLVPQAWIARGGTAATYRDLQAAIGAANSSASPGAKAVAAERAKALDQYFAKNAELTKPEKELRSQGLPGEDLPAYEARKAATKTRDEGIQTIANETYKTAATGYAAAQDSGQGLDAIKQSIDALGPTGWMGANATQRMALARTLNSVADSLLPKNVADKVKFDPAKLAVAEDFVKQSQRLTFAVARTLGPREAVQIVQQAGSSVPNIEQSPLGAKLVWSSLNQAKQRATDYYEYMSQPENRGRPGAEIGFNKQNPPEKYSIRATYDAGLPLHINDQEDGARQKYNLAPGGMVIIDQNGHRWTKPKAG